MLSYFKWSILISSHSVPILRRLVLGLSSWTPAFDSKQARVGCVMDKLALGHIFSYYFGFLLSTSFQKNLHTHSFNYHTDYMVICAVFIPSRRNVRGWHRQQNYRRKRQAGGFEGVPSHGLGGRQQWARPRGGQLLHATRNQESQVCRRGMGCGQTYVTRPQRTVGNDVLCNVKF